MRNAETKEFPAILPLTAWSSILMSYTTAFGHATLNMRPEVNKLIWTKDL